MTGGYPRPTLTLFNIGLYDSKGQSLARLSASEWQTWAPPPSAPTLIPLDKVLARSLAHAGANAYTAADGSAYGQHPLSGSRCLLEVQMKRQDTGPQESLGWGVCPLLSPPYYSEANSNPSNPSNPPLCVANNAWKTVMRKGLSDPNCSLKDIPDTEECLGGAFFLVRIVDVDELGTASSWSLHDAHTEMLLTTEDEVASFYTTSPPYSGGGGEGGGAAAAAIGPEVEAGAGVPGTASGARASRSATPSSTTALPTLHEEAGGGKAGSVHPSRAVSAAAEHRPSTVQV